MQPSTTSQDLWYTADGERAKYLRESTFEDLADDLTLSQRREVPSLEDIARNSRLLCRVEIEIESHLNVSLRWRLRLNTQKMLGSDADGAIRA